MKDRKKDKTHGLRGGKEKTMKKFNFEMKENGFDLSITVSGKESQGKLPNYYNFPKMDVKETVTHNGEQCSYFERDNILKDFREIVSVCRMAWPGKIYDEYGRRIEYNASSASRMADDCPLKSLFDEKLGYLNKETTTTYCFRRRSGKPHKNAQAKDGSYYVEAEHLPDILGAINACEKRASARKLDWDMLDLIKWICDGCQQVDTFEKMPKTYKYKVSYTWIKLNDAGNIIFGRDEDWGN